MSSITAYAEAMLRVAEAEGDAEAVVDEMFRFGEALENSDELTMILGNATLDAGRRQQIVEDLLGGKARPTTIGLVSMAVAAGKARELPEMVAKLVQLGASTNDRRVALVRSAVPLSDDQLSRLSEALGQAVGGHVEIKATVDPSVVGGVVTTIGDTVIDGTVRSRLAQLREAF
jgi:F-type H+-transporting ATPase subunit delta